MSSVSAFWQWDAGCVFTASNQCDSGMRGWHFDYLQPWPCPNGLPIKTGVPSECEAHQRRVAKAKREIETHSEHIDWRERVAAAHVEWPSESVTMLKEFIERQYE